MAQTLEKIAGAVAVEPKELRNGSCEPKSESGLNGSGLFSRYSRKLGYILGMAGLVGMLSCTNANPANPDSVFRFGVTCPGGVVGDVTAKPQISIVGLRSGDTDVKGTANNIDGRVNYVVLYAKTNDWYVQPLVVSPRTDICSNGTWQNWTHPWDSMVALLVDQTYQPSAIKYTDPTADRGVVAWAKFP